MNGCACPHEVNEHGTLAEFGQQICLVAGCDCNGTHAQVAAAGVARAIRMSSTAEAVYRAVLEVLSNPFPRTTDDMARNIAAAIVGNFEVEPR